MNDMDEYRQELIDEYKNQVAELCAALAECRAALKFYADSDHLYGTLADDWDTCSDHEMAGWRWPCEPVDEQSWGVEDGLIARAALAKQADKP